MEETVLGIGEEGRGEDERLRELGENAEMGEVVVDVEVKGRNLVVRNEMGRKMMVVE